MKFLIQLIVFAVLMNLSASSMDVYPTHWWTGMKNQSLQIMFHQKDIGEAKILLKNYPGVKLINSYTPENKNYIFVDIRITNEAKPGLLQFNFSSPKGNVKFNYQLKERAKGNGVSRAQGVTSKDLIYLIMPDRFSNGNPTNDTVQGMQEQHLDRNDPFSRHGGDLKGVSDHLDYIKETGFTTIWMTPVVENDMPLMNEWGHQVAGYHGYWFTDHYNVDKRLGGNKAYAQMVSNAHSKGLKVIQDAVYNHVGNHHWFVLDPPSKDWLNQWPSYQGSNHKEEVFYDPYVAAIDKEIMIGGWFVPHLPDLNLKNKYLARFLIQHAIWSTEEFGIDGWRVDTYKYCDENFMNDVNAALMKEFPKLSIFGESWCSTPVATAYFTNNNLNVPFKHNLPGVTDFPVSFGLKDAADQKNGVEKLYSLIAQDFLYKNPQTNCIFLDNHDMDRIFSVLGEDISKMKIAAGMLLTTRGIPQVYYGTEILMKNFKNPSDAEVRRDFPGGWMNDTINKFLSTGRTEKENEFYNYFTTLAKFRKNSNALQIGKTLQFQPSNNVYVYFRYHENEKVMCIVNAEDKQKELKMDRFSSMLNYLKSGKEVNSGKIIDLNETLTLQPKSMLIIELNSSK